MAHRIRPPDYVRFTQGDCHIFARAVNKLTGYPIYCFVAPAGSGYDEEPDTHAFVVDPQGRAIDIEGRHEDMDAFIANWSKWGSDQIREYSWKELRHSWGGPDFGNYSYERARQLAPLVV